MSDSGKKASHVFIGTDAESGRFGGNRQKLLVAVSAAVVIVGIVIALWAVFGHHGSPVAAVPKQTGSATDVADTPETQALIKAHNGDYAGAQKVLSDAVNNTSSPTEKAALYEAQSEVAQQAKDYTSAQTYAQQANNSSATAQSLKTLGNLAMQRGDKTAAAQYYQQAIDKLDKTAPSYASRLSELNYLKQRAQQ